MGIVMSMAEIDITVLMPVYNTGKYLREAIDSILAQSYTGFTLLIINDGSSDDSEDIILSYSDSRIQYVKNEKNIGLVATLNRGLDLAATPYIARMDGDDISAPERLQVLREFMNGHPEVGVCSSYLELFGDKKEVWETPLEDDSIKATLLFFSSIGHACSIMRTSVLKKHGIYYRDIHPHMEDFDLWYRLMDKTDFANIPRNLYFYRITGTNVTEVNRSSYLDRKKHFFLTILRDLDIEPTEEELLLHIGLTGIVTVPLAGNILKYRNWLDKLLDANKKSGRFPHKALVKIAGGIWDRLFFKIVPYGLKEVWNYWKWGKGPIKKQVVYYAKYRLNRILGRS